MEELGAHVGTTGRGRQLSTAPVGVILYLFRRRRVVMGGRDEDNGGEKVTTGDGPGAHASSSSFFSFSSFSPPPTTTSSAFGWWRKRWRANRLGGRQYRGGWRAHIIRTQCRRNDGRRDTHTHTHTRREVRSYCSFKNRYFCRRQKQSRTTRARVRRRQSL